MCKQTAQQVDTQARFASQELASYQRSQHGVIQELAQDFCSVCINGTNSCVKMALIFDYNLGMHMKPKITLIKYFCIYK